MMEYAIVDIETTGAYASQNRMTEIAIVIHDGTGVLQRWESLINPQKPIPSAIFALTGINEDLVKDAPIFEDIAHQVYALLEGRVFVAHHVNFDYSFVKHELAEAGYIWSAKKLCTVRLARKIRPGLVSYSLGRLCHYLEIPNHARHRAGGDVAATSLLFERLLDWDTAHHVRSMLKKSAAEQRLPSHLPPKALLELPNCTGVYYFHNQAGKIIYVGKANAIQKRVNAHFSGHNISPQRQHFLRDIWSISTEECATELYALLVECIAIKQHWPIYNSALKRFEPKFGLISYRAQNGIDQLAILPLRKHQLCLQVFQTNHEGIQFLQNLISAYQLDYRYCHMGQQHAVDKSPKAIDNAEIDAYNIQVAQALASLADALPSFIIQDRGRNPDEQSLIWVQDGNLYAMGYLPKDFDISAVDKLKASLPRQYGNPYMMHLIHKYAAQYPHFQTS